MVFKVKFVREFFVQCNNGYENFCWCMDCVLHTLLDWYRLIMTKGVGAVVSPVTFVAHRLYMSVRRLYAKYRHHRRSKVRGITFSLPYPCGLLVNTYPTIPNHLLSRNVACCLTHTLPYPTTFSLIRNGTRIDDSR